MEAQRYYVSVTSGLEDVAWDEISEKLTRPQLVSWRRGRIFFETNDPPARLLMLRSVDNVFVYLGEMHGLTAARESLGQIQHFAQTLDVSTALLLHSRVHGDSGEPSFRVTSKRSGTHDFNSIDIQCAAGQGLVDRHGWRVDLTGHDLEFRFDVNDDVCLAGLRLSDSSLHRRSRVVHGVASLKPTVAYCMIRLAGVAPNDVFVDPMCGAATILIERADAGPYRLLFGGDLFVKPLRLAQQNIAAAHLHADLFRWDARRLPLREQSVDRVVCNLPFGRRVGSHDVNVRLYPGLLRSLARVLKPGAQAVLLSLERRLLERLLTRHKELQLLRRIPINLAELHPSVYVLAKTSQ